MTTKTAVCGIYDLRQITKPSDVWCSECDEGLCVECKEHHSLSKGTRNNNTVPISQYEKLPTNVLEISQFCSEHKEKFQIYCKKHDCPCCSRCIVSHHQKCQEFSHLDDMSRNVKESHGFREIEQAMIDMIVNILKIKKDRQANLSTLKEEREMIEKEILQTRMKINAQLDNLQEALIKELYEAESKENKMIGQLLDSIEKNEKEIREYQENIISIKQHASDLQTFLVMKHLERDVADKDKYFTSLVKSNKLNRVSLSCKMNDVLQSCFNKIQKLGEIIVSTHSSEVAVVKKREAQTVVVHVQSSSIENLSFVLQATIDTKLKDVRGCTMLPDGRMAFSSLKQNIIRVFNIDGSKEFKISSQLTFTFDITYINDDNSIAVTSGNGVEQCIKLINLESRKIKETIKIKSFIYGIVSRNNTLIYCVPKEGLRMMNLSDKSDNDIVTGKLSYCAYVAAFSDKLYYTNNDSHTVTCCDLHGTSQWEFKDGSVLSQPYGISVYNAGNVYVSGYKSHNVVVISPDGQRDRELLSAGNGINFPLVLHYDRSTNQLLVVDETGKAFLFRLE